MRLITCWEVGAILLVGDGLTKRFGGVIALNRVSLEVQTSEVVGVIGPNGSGKTTLLSILSGFVRADEGSLFFEGRRISGRAAPYQLSRLGVARTFQIVRPFCNLTVRENVLIAARFAGSKTGSEAIKLADEVLSLAGLDKKATMQARDLTLQDKKRLELARALATAPKILLLDEILAGLNEQEVADAVALLKRIREEKKIAILMVEHIMSAIKSLCNRVIVLNSGQKLAEGSYEEVAHNPSVVEAYLGSSADVELGRLQQDGERNVG